MALRSTVPFVTQADVNTKFVCPTGVPRCASSAHAGRSGHTSESFQFPPRHCLSVTESTATSEMPLPVANLTEQSFVV